MTLNAQNLKFVCWAEKSFYINIKINEFSHWHNMIDLDMFPSVNLFTASTFILAICYLCFFKSSLSLFAPPPSSSQSSFDVVDDSFSHNQRYNISMNRFRICPRCSKWYIIPRKYCIQCSFTMFHPDTYTRDIHYQMDYEFRTDKYKITVKTERGTNKSISTICSNKTLKGHHPDPLDPSEYIEYEVVFGPVITLQIKIPPKADDLDIKKYLILA